MGEDIEELKSVLRRNGFRPCDIAACNCGSWHAGPNLRAERAEERVDALVEALEGLLRLGGTPMGRAAARQKAKAALALAAKP